MVASVMTIERAYSGWLPAHRSYWPAGANGWQNDFFWFFSQFRMI